MTARPYITLSCAVSLDGYLDTADPPRLTLSNGLDLDRVDGLRAASDAILVGARTVRLDDPRLLVRSLDRRDDREASGRSPSPWKVTVTRTGDLDPRAAFFTQGDAPKVVYCPRSQARRITGRLGDRALVVGLGVGLTMADLAADLGERGVRRLMVEGGGTIHTQFLQAELADELQLAVAPLFVGDSRAPRFVGAGAFPWDGERRATLLDARPVGDVVLLRYALSERAVAAGRGDSDGRGGVAGRGGAEARTVAPEAGPAGVTGHAADDRRGAVPALAGLFPRGSA